MIILNKEKIAKSYSLMTLFFIFEVLLFIFCGIAINRGELLISIVYLTLGLGDAYFLGEAIKVRGIRGYENKHRRY